MSGNRLKCQNGTEENRRFQNGTLFPIFWKQNNQRQLIEVIAVFIHQRPKVNPGFKIEQRKGGVLFMCAGIIAFEDVIKISEKRK